MNKIKKVISLIVFGVALTTGLHLAKINNRTQNKKEIISLVSTCKLSTTELITNQLKSNNNCLIAKSEKYPDTYTVIITY